MSLSSLLRSLFHRAPSGRAGAAPTPGPGQGSRANVHGQHLLGRLDRLSSERRATSGGVVLGSGMNALTVPSETLVQRHRRSPLDANWVSPGAIMMSSPETRAEGFDWARLCHEHRVTTVIDVSPPTDVAPWWIAKGNRTSAPDGGDEAKFQVLGTPVARNTRADGDLMMSTNLVGARERQVNLRWKAVGRAETSRSLAWTRLPVAPGGSPDPAMLLLMCRRLQARAAASSSPQVVAFQDTNGGNTAAVFTAALELFRQHVRRPLTRDGLDEAIARTCDELRQGRSQTLFTGRPDLMAALHVFGTSMIDAGPWQTTVEEHGSMKPLALEPSEHPPVLIGQPASGLRGLLRQARATGRAGASPARTIRFADQVNTASFSFSAPTGDSIRFHVKRPFLGEPKAPPARLPLADRVALARKDRPWDDQPETGSDIARSR